MKIFIPFSLICLLLILIPWPTYAGTLTSNVNRNQININETLTLTVKYDEQVGNNALDLTELEADFDVLSSTPQSSNRISIINGQTTREASTTWSIILTPKRSGQLRIPALSINGNSSDAFSINVSSSNKTTESQTPSEPISVNVSTSPTVAYPGQQIVIKVELSVDQSVSDVRGEQLHIDGAPIEPVDKQSFQRIDNGIARQVVIWTYVTFAPEWKVNSTEKQEAITLPSQTFTGLANASASRGFFSQRNQGQQVFARSTPVSIELKEMPENPARHPWLPADDVSILATWSGDKEQLRVGEPITRTIEVIAKGQLANAITPLKLANNSKDYKAYADQPKLENNTSTHGIVGKRIEAQAIIPSNSGQLTLPEQRIHWWNIKTQQWQEAVLAAETLNIAPAIANQQSTDSATVTPTIDPLLFPENGQTVQGPKLSELSNSDSDNWLWQLVSMVLLIICIVQGWLLYNIFQRQKSTDSLQDPLSSPTEAKAWKQLKTALQSNDASNIRQRLIEWSKHAFPEQKQHTLETLSQYSNHKELATQLNKLDRHLFKGDTLDFSQLPTVITQLRQDWLKGQQQSTKSSELAPLYPS